MGSDHKYSSLEEVAKVIDEKWIDGECPPDTPENREIVECSKYWIGVETVRFNYSGDFLLRFLHYLLFIESKWKDGGGA